MVPTKDAIIKAQEFGLDLVEVAPNAAPPVCRIMDYGKYKYQQGKRHSAKKSAGLKEMKIRPRIDSHDLELKARHIRRFLDDGNKAKISMFFRGRERAKPEMGMKVFHALMELLNTKFTGKYSIEQEPRMEGASITMVIAPKQ